MPIRFAFDIHAAHVLLRAVGLLAALIIFVSLGYLEYVGKPAQKSRRIVAVIVVIGGLLLAGVLVALNGS